MIQLNKRKSLLDGYQETQLIAIVIVVVTISLTIGVMLYAYKRYTIQTNISYIHLNGVTLQINAKNSKK